jgi:tRNA (guanine26-N2/guanine27-N2)-dimethyltransferase
LSIRPLGRVIEGNAKLFFDSNHDVFYNPKMEMNRDIGVLFVRSYFRTKPIRVCDPMTASGVRAIRYALECPNVESVTASDADPVSVDYATRMIQLNHLSERIFTVKSDAITLFQSRGDTRFDFVDLDPFGCPAPFFESALRCATNEGILAATATDMAPLTGVRPAACFRKYGVISVRTEFEKEIAIRVLAACLSFAAGRLQLGAKVIFAHASDHYARIYVQVNNGRRASNDTMRNLGFLEYCPMCLHRSTRRLLERYQSVCEKCSSSNKILGPIWLGKLWDGELVTRMSEYAATIVSSRLSDVQTLLDHIREETNAPAFYHRVDKIARNLRTNPSRLRNIISELRSQGYVATLTHFHPNGFRTNASDDTIRGAFSLAKKT